MYFIVKGDFCCLFIVNSDGIIIVFKDLDYEKNLMYDVRVVVYDKG